MLAASDAGKHALLVADTGAGKTLAGFLPTLADFAPSRLADNKPHNGLHTLYVSPLKALALMVCIRFRKPGLPSRCPSVATVSRDKLFLRLRSSSKTRIPPMLR